MKKLILVTGSKGLVGSAIKDISKEYENKFEFYFSARENKFDDLTSYEETDSLFREVCPWGVLHCAGRIGGIQRNLNSPAQQYTDNIMINTNVIDCAYKIGVEKLIAFSSVCAFPAKLDILQEDKLHDGEPFPAHRSYAYSKRMVDIQLEAYKQQYGFNGCSLIPVNIFGPNDNYNFENGHIVPSLIHKCLLAKNEAMPLEVWGHGFAQREFIFSRDLAKICLEMLSFDEFPLRLIVPGPEYAINEIVSKICNIMDHNNVKYLENMPH